MIRPRSLVGLVLWALLGASQPLPPAAAQTPPAAAARTGGEPPADARETRLTERYKAMLAANPVEGLALDRLWKAAEEQNATSALLEEYHRAAEAQPPQIAPILIYGHLLVKAGRPDEAQAAFQQAVTVDGAGILPWLAAGDLSSGRGQPREAAQAYEKAVTRLPAGDRLLPETLLKLGNAWAAANEPVKAAGAWERIVAANPGDLGLHRRLAENYEKNHLLDRAIGHYETIEQHADPEQRAAALRELARLHETRGEVDAASAALERALALTSRDNWLRTELEQNLIRLYQRADRLPELAARWRADLTKNPRDLAGYLRLEHLAAAQGNTEEQRSWLEQIVALAPKDRENTLKLARLLNDAGERERAGALYDSQIKEQPANLDLVLARAEIDLQLGQTGKAVERIEACVERSRNDESVTTPALQFLLAHHLDEAAVRRLQADVSRSPQSEEPVLALARFYFVERRDAEAKAILEGLRNRPAEPAARAATLMRIAECYAGHLDDDALRCWREAAGLAPTNAAALLAAGDLLARRGQTDGAQENLERALQVAAPGPDAVDIDHKLFELVQTADYRSPDTSTVPTPPPGPPRRFRDAMAAAAGAGANASANQRVPRYIAGLAKAARLAPTPGAYLRLAHWQEWNHAITDAAATAENVITLDPGNIPARDLLVGIALEMRQRDTAEQRLREIMQLNPARTAECQRQIAGLTMEDGNFDEGLALYESLAQGAAGSVAALTDLAVAQQRADRWYDALTTWERAYALPGATPAERSSVRRPLLLALERLGQYPRGAEILQAAIDSSQDVSARQDLLRELTAFCRAHDLTPWLRQTYAERVAAQPLDYFTLTALATLEQSSGHEREAYRLLRRADFSAPDPARSLHDLTAAAEALGDAGDAASWQRRLLTLTGQDTADNLEKLADLQDNGLATDDAARTWDRILARFPRQTEVLEKAADFFEKARRPERARELLGQLVALDPTGLARIYRLGGLDLAADDRLGARRCFEQVLARSDEEKPGQPFVPPGQLRAAPVRPDGSFVPPFSSSSGFRMRLSTTGAVSEPEPTPPADEHQLRLAAIRELGGLLFGTGEGAGARPPPRQRAGSRSLDREVEERGRPRAAERTALGLVFQPRTGCYDGGPAGLDAEIAARGSLAGPLYRRGSPLGRLSYAGRLGLGRCQHGAHRDQWPGTCHGPHRVPGARREAAAGHGRGSVPAWRDRAGTALESGRARVCGAGSIRGSGRTG